MKTHAVILLLSGVGLLFVGISITASTTEPGITHVLGLGIAFFGDLLVFYAIYRGIRWIWIKVKGKTKSEKTPSVVQYK